MEAVAKWCGARRRWGRGESGLRLAKVSLVDRYVFKQVTGTFAGMVVAMLAVIVCVVALQELDVVTNQGAALATFAMLTLLSMPQMLSMVAPIAFFLALLMTLNRLSAESEIVVVNASGGSPFSLLRPVMAAALVVSLLVAALAHLISPPAQMAWRFMITDVRADLLSTVVREGAFSTIQDGLTFHMRERQPGGVLSDIMIADTRDHPQEMIYFAQRGTIVRGEQGAFLSVEDGLIQRRSVSQTGRVTSAYLYFDTYSIDLSFTERSSGPGQFKPSERSTAYLFDPDPDDRFLRAEPGRFTAELHNRMALPLYPLAYAMIITMALGTPHAARSGRGKRVLLAVAGGSALLTAQLGIFSLIGGMTFIWPVLYLLPILVLVFGLLFLAKKLPAPQWLGRFLSSGGFRRTEAA